jgi:uncharacterized RDD family membrane protein YckC
MQTQDMPSKERRNHEFNTAASYPVFNSGKLHPTQSSFKSFPLRYVLAFVLAGFSLFFIVIAFVLTGRKDNIFLYLTILHILIVNFVFLIIVKSRFAIKQRSRSIFFMLFISALFLAYVSGFIINAPKGLITIFISWIIVILVNSLFYAFITRKSQRQ